MDPYILFLKSIMLFGRVMDYTVCMGIQSPLVDYGHYEPVSLPGITGITPLTSAMGLSSPPNQQHTPPVLEELSAPLTPPSPPHPHPHPLQPQDPSVAHKRML